MSGHFEYRVIRDGWIKVPAARFFPDLSNLKSDRLLLGVNQLLLRMAGKTILVDTGLGEKWSPGEVGLIDFEEPRRLPGELEAACVNPGDIDIVILTHLHPDHSGGGTIKTASGLAPTFTNAIYCVQQNELRGALRSLALGEGSFNRDDNEPLMKTGQLVALDGEAGLLPGLKVLPTPGHSPGHQVVVAQLGRRTLFFPGDLIATRQHALWKSNDPQLDLQRRRWIRMAADGNWRCVFCHAPNRVEGRLSRQARA